MQIVPTVLILLSVLGFLSFSIMHTFSFSQVEAKHFTAHIDAHAMRISTLQKKLFDKLPATEKEKKKGAPTKRTTIFIPRTKRDVFQPVHLGALKKGTNQPQLRSFAKKYFITLYKTVTYEGEVISEKHLRKLFDSIIMSKDGKKVLENDPFGQKILRGTHRIDLSKPKGYPGFFEAFSFEEKDASIPFRGIPKELLPLLFSEKQAKQLLDEEIKKSTRANRPCTLNMHEFQELFPVRTPLMNLFYFDTKAGSPRVSDKDEIVELLLHGNANSNEVPSPSTDETESVKL